MRDITFGGSGLVAVGTDGPFLETDAAVWTSSDGLTWSRVPSEPDVFGGADEQMMLGVSSGQFGGEDDLNMSSVIVGGLGLVAVGRGSLDNAAVWTATNRE